ncbi:unnamed protein product [Lampetra planeri]
MARSSPETMLSALTTDCKVVVNVTNNSRYTLSEPRFFLKSGICQFPHNEPITPRRRALYGFRKMSSDVKGCHGILGLRFKGTDEYLVLLFKIPLMYQRRKLALSMENCAGVCDMDLRKLREMTRQEATADGRFAWSHAGPDCLVVKSEVLRVRVKAEMSACHEAIAHVTVMDDGVDEPHKKSPRIKHLIKIFENDVRADN